MTISSEPILVATDLSARADRAVDRALALGRRLGRPVVAVHVMSDDSKLDAVEIERRVRAAMPEDTGAEARVVIGRGPVQETIASIAERENAALICAGVARYNSVGDYILGTAIDYLCRQSDRPLLVAKTRSGAPYEAIVFPTDFSACSRDALVQAMRLFPQARFHLIHAWHVPYAAWNKDESVKEDLDEGAEEAMRDLIASVSNDPANAARLQGKAVGGNLFNAVYAMAEESGANLVAFGTHGESGLRHATIGSIASEMLHKLTLDSLIIRGRS